MPRRNCARREKVLGQATDRAALLNEIVAMVHAEIESMPRVAAAAGAGAAKEFVEGSHGLLTAKDVKDLTLAFEKKFDRPMPVSARGETAVHQRVGVRSHGADGRRADAG